MSGEATLREAQKLLANVQQGDFSAMRPKEVLAAAELVIKLSRLVDGASTENVAVATVSYKNLTDEELDQLSALAQKAGA